LLNAYPGREDDFLTRIGRRLTLWVLGSGLLSLHATIFTLTIIGIVFWNIYDAPDDLWVADVFRRWGVLLLFHGIAVAAGWTAWRLLRAEQHAIDANRTPWSPPAETPYPPIAINTWQPPSTFQQVESARSGSTLQQTGRSLKQFAAYSAIWTSRLGRTAASATQSVSSRLSGKKGNAAASSGVPPASPVQTWPQGPIRTDEDDQLIARYGGSPSKAATLPASDRELLPNGGPAGSQIEGTPSAPIIGKEAGQTWIEAATTGRSMPRDGETPEPNTLNGTHAQNGNSAAPYEDNSN